MLTCFPPWCLPCSPPLASCSPDRGERMGKEASGLGNGGGGLGFPGCGGKTLLPLSVHPALLLGGVTPWLLSSWELEPSRLQRTTSGTVWAGKKRRLRPITIYGHTLYFFPRGKLWPGSFVAQYKMQAKIRRIIYIGGFPTSIGSKCKYFSIYSTRTKLFVYFDKKGISQRHHSSTLIVTNLSILVQIELQEFIRTTIHCHLSIQGKVAC